MSILAYSRLYDPIENPYAPSEGFKEVMQTLMIAYRSQRIDADQYVTLSLCFSNQFAEKTTPAGKVELASRWLKVLAR